MEIQPIHRITDFQSSHGGDVFSFKAAGWSISAEYDDQIEQVVFDAYNESLDLEASGRVEPSSDCQQRIVDICLTRGL